MAIYRSDQAQFTFAAGEGPPEAALATAVGSGLSTTLTAAVNPGDTVITLASAGSLKGSHVTGSDKDQRYIIIDSSATTSNQVTSGTIDHASVPEVRRVTHVSGTAVTVDPPLAFPHGDGALVKNMDYSEGLNAQTQAESSNYGGLDIDKFITWFPGVYDSVDCPDVEEAFDQRYILGQNTNRNVYQYYKGQQAYTGSVSGMVLLNGFPLRFPVGKVISVPSAVSALTNATGMTGTAGSPMIQLINSATVSIPNGTTILIGGADVGGTNTGSTQVLASDVPGVNARQEVRRVVSGGGSISSGNAYLRLNYPLFFDHTSGSNSGTVTQLAASAVTFHHYLMEL